MSDFNTLMLVATLISIAGIVWFLMWLEFFYKNHLQKAVIYAIDCKNRGIDRYDTIKLIAHYLEWNVTFGESDEYYSRGSSDQQMAYNTAHGAVEIAFTEERTEENTKPRIGVPAEIE